MPLKYQYFIFIGILHISLTILIYYVLKDLKWYFILSETLIIVSLYISYKIFRSFIQPLELMRSGIDAIKEEDFNVKFLKTSSSDINNLIVVFNKMLDKLGQERIRTQEQAYFLKNLIKASPIGMIILGFDGEITNMNISARNYFNLAPDKQLEELDDIQHPLIDEINALPVDASKILSIDGVQKFRCQTSIVIHKGFKRKFVMIEELSKELLESEKEAYGKVIRMMAHEVNNSMGAVNSILQSVIDFAFHEAHDSEYAESLSIAKNRNEHLAKFMKNFADVIRLPEPVLKPANILLLVDQVIGIMTPMSADRSISIETIKTDSIPKFLIDLNLFQQVLMNILKNSIESIENNGKIRVIISDKTPHLVIADNGPGISSEVQQKIFSPFYSTKVKGQGIGLIITRDILLGHNATFSLETRKETGWTEFSISLMEASVL